MSNFVHDTFSTGSAGTDLNARTGETGATWAQNAANARSLAITAGGRVRANFAVAGTGAYYASGAPASANYSVKADFLVDTVTGNPFGVMARLDTTANTWYWGRYSGTAWNLIGRLNGGGLSTVGTDVIATLTAAQTYSTYLSVVGTQITLWVANSGSVVAKISGSNSTVAATGKGGLAIGLSTTVVQPTDSTDVHGDNFDATDLAFSVSPTSVNAGSSGNSLTLTGAGTYWSVLTPTITASAGTITGQVINSDASITLTYTAASAGTVTLTDPSSGQTCSLTIASAGASFVVSPTTATTSTPLTITATGTGTSWVSGTTTFAVSGGTGASISSLSINNGTQVATFTLNPGSSAGTLTISDTTDAATAAVTVSAAASLAVSPTSGVAGSGGINLTLTGTSTSWTPGTPGSPTFTTSAGTLVGQSVASTSSATATLLPSAAGGTTTITDPGTGKTATVSVSLPTVTTKVVCAGNSLTAGSSADGTAVPYPTTLAAILGPAYSVQNSGIGGQAGAQILAAFTAQIGQYYQAGKANVLVLWEVTNDLYFNASAATAYSNLVSISAAWKALNAANKVICIACLPRSNFPGTSTISGTAAQQLATFEANRQTANASIRASSSFDAVVDLAVDQRIGFLGDQLNPAYYDGSFVHLNAAGYLAVAQAVAAEVLGRGATSAGGQSFRGSIRNGGEL